MLKIQVICHLNSLYFFLRIVKLGEIGFIKKMQDKYSMKDKTKMLKHSMSSSEDHVDTILIPLGLLLLGIIISVLWSAVCERRCSYLRCP